MDRSKRMYRWAVNAMLALIAIVSFSSTLNAQSATNQNVSVQPTDAAKTTNERLHGLIGQRQLSNVPDDVGYQLSESDETIDALGQLVTDAGGILDQLKEGDSGFDADTVRIEHEDLTDRIMKFESEHPQVTRFLHQVTDVLAMMGI